jgi:hypothetical protein
MSRSGIRDIDRVAAAVISFACIYVGLFIAFDFSGFAYVYGPWTICIVPVVVAAILIKVRGLTNVANTTWKLWLLAFAANCFGIVVMGLPVFYLIIRMHEI